MDTLSLSLEILQLSNNFQEPSIEGNNYDLLLHLSAM